MYYLLYDEYTEYNQFEGQWDKTWEIIKDKKTALAVKESYKNRWDIKNVVLTKLQKVENV